MTQELKPCPFCGSNDLRQVVHDLSGDDNEPFGYSISCNSCFVDLPPAYTQMKCFADWNTRAYETALESAEKALVECRKEFWDDWHSDMSEESFNTNPTIEDIDSTLIRAAKGKV